MTGAELLAQLRLEYFDLNAMLLEDHETHGVKWCLGCVLETLDDALTHQQKASS